ncbi:MAG: 50S ribosomal protein L18e [Euryarchaeota archaeon]|nr:50S ribosomal protein L18e [Euryarchaeota archaeon]
MKKSKTTNTVLQRTIDELIQTSYREDVNIWRDLARRLSRSRSRRAEVNVGKLARFTKKGDVVAVPGKILGSGVIEHPITVAAFNFSASAAEKIARAGGKCLTLSELVSNVPKGTNVRIME